MTQTQIPFGPWHTAEEKLRVQELYDVLCLHGEEMPVQDLARCLNAAVSEIADYIDDLVQLGLAYASPASRGGSVTWTINRTSTINHDRIRTALLALGETGKRIPPATETRYRRRIGAHDETVS